MKNRNTKEQQSMKYKQTYNRKKINKAKSLFSEKSDKIYKSLKRLTKKKVKNIQINNIRNDLQFLPIFEDNKNYRKIYAN